VLQLTHSILELCIALLCGQHVFALEDRRVLLLLTLVNNFDPDVCRSVMPELGLLVGLNAALSRAVFPQGRIGQRQIAFCAQTITMNFKLRLANFDFVVFATVHLV